MTQLTILLSVDAEANRFRLFVVELRALEDGSAELHRRGGIGRTGAMASNTFSTVRLTESARAELLERRRQRGYVRADLGTARERARDGLDLSSPGKRTRSSACAGRSPNAAKRSARARMRTTPSSRCRSPTEPPEYWFGGGRHDPRGALRAGCAG